MDKPFITLSELGLDDYLQAVWDHPDCPENWSLPSPELVRDAQLLLEHSRTLSGAEIYALQDVIDADPSPADDWRKVAAIIQNHIDEILCAK